jgi:hypothetical protein
VEINLNDNACVLDGGDLFTGRSTHHKPLLLFEHASGVYPRDVVDVTAKGLSTSQYANLE